ncbi:MAG: hypothetical protein Q7L55_04685 [Actinomycetota bacterium]|nr:hypothetical protein [Actinomycetota bacterium]
MKVLLLIASAAALCLAGCSSSADSPPLAACNQASLQTTIDAFLHESQSHLDSFDKLDCSGQWALVQASVTDEGSKPAKQVFVFARSGQNWILKAPESVCGSPSADDSRPADAEIPADLWPQACLIP